VSRSTVEELSEYLNMPIPKIKARLLLRNCVEPTMGLHIFESVYKESKQKLLSEFHKSHTQANLMDLSFNKGLEVTPTASPN